MIEQYGQLVRPIDFKDRQNMVEAALRGELQVSFPDNSDQAYFNRLRDVEHDYSNSAASNFLADSRPTTMIGNGADAETLFALRFGKFERITQV